jgi:hypothetical protein
MVEIITAQDLEEHGGETCLFQRGDVRLEGRLYLTNDKYRSHDVTKVAHDLCEELLESGVTPEGQHFTKVRPYRSNRRINDKFVVVPINGYCVSTLWDKVRDLGTRNPTHDNWDILVMTGDRVTFHYNLGERLDSSATQYEVRL